MLRKIFALLIATVFVISCGAGNPAQKTALKFKAELAGLSQTLENKKETLKTRDDFLAYQAAEKIEFENLLQKYAGAEAIAPIEILRSKALMRLQRLDEAVQKIDPIINGNTNAADSVEARMVKVLILIQQANYTAAADIFKTIADAVRDPDDFYSALFNLAMYHEDDSIREKYSLQFLNAKKLPAAYQKYQFIIYSNLAEIAALAGDIEKAKEFLNKGMASPIEENKKVYLLKQLDQLDFTGKEAFPISANTWIHSEPVKLADLKGKVVVIAFWAPWSRPCLAMLPSLIEAHNNFRDKGLVLIGYTRHYGRYEDDLEDKGIVSADEETELIKQFSERNHISFPVAVADEKTDYETYEINSLPALVFINKKGFIDFIKTGSASTKLVNKRVTRLLEEM